MDMGSGVSCADARGVEREEVKMMMMVACAGERVDDRIESNAGVCTIYKFALVSSSGASPSVTAGVIELLDVFADDCDAERAAVDFVIPRSRACHLVCV